MGHNALENAMDVLRGKAPMGELPKQKAPWIPNKPTPKPEDTSSTPKGVNKFVDVLEGKKK